VKKEIWKNGFPGRWSTKNMKNVKKIVEIGYKLVEKLKNFNDAQLFILV
jgi:hypothetical protein